MDTLLIDNETLKSSIFSGVLKSQLPFIVFEKEQIIIIPWKLLQDLQHTEEGNYESL